jgi:hypothetical protein
MTALKLIVATDKHQHTQRIIKLYNLCAYDKESEDTGVPNEKILNIT